MVTYKKRASTSISQYLVLRLTVKTYFFLNKMFSNIAFQHIKDDFWLGQYDEFSVVMMKSSGYINATHLCKAGGKRFNDWKQTNSCKSLIKALEDFLSIRASGNTHTDNLTLLDTETRIPVSVFKSIVTENKSDVDQLIYGTYCHNLLMPHIASWISSTFALRISCIVNDYMVKEYMEKLEKAEALLQMADKQVSMLQHEGAEKDAKIMEKNDIIIQLTEDRNVVAEALSNKKKDLQAWASTHSFTLMSIEENNAKFPLYVIRCKHAAVKSSINKLRRKYPNATVVFQHNQIPNAVNLYDRLYNEKHVLRKRNYCLSTHGDMALITTLKEMCGAEDDESNENPMYHTPPTSPDIFQCEMCGNFEQSALHLHIHRIKCSFNYM